MNESTSPPAAKRARSARLRPPAWVGWWKLALRAWVGLQVVLLALALWLPGNPWDQPFAVWIVIGPGISIGAGLLGLVGLVTVVLGAMTSRTEVLPEAFLAVFCSFFLLNSAIIFAGGWLTN